MASSTSDMRLSGGHPALDLVNSVDSRRGRWGPDFLRSFDDVLVLAERTALLDPEEASRLSAQAGAEPERARAALARTVALREAVHALFIAEDAGRDVPPEALDTVEAVAREGRGRARLRLLGARIVWRLPFDEPEDVARAFAVAAADLLIARPERREVRECKGDNCGWLFLDRSKAGRRVWCSDASCGARSRVARFRATAP